MFFINSLALALALNLALALKNVVTRPTDARHPCLSFGVRYCASEARVEVTLTHPTPESIGIFDASRSPPSLEGILKTLALALNLNQNRYLYRIKIDHDHNHDHEHGELRSQLVCLVGRVMG